MTVFDKILDVMAGTVMATIQFLCGLKGHDYHKPSGLGGIMCAKCFKRFK